jgi:hypothetical protein
MFSTTHFCIAYSGNEFTENKSVLLKECVVNRRGFLCSVTLKLNVIHYAKEHSNSTAERHVGPPPKQKETHK